MTCRHDPYRCIYKPDYVACMVCHTRWSKDARGRWQPDPRPR